MTVALFRFHEGLASLVAPARRDGWSVHDCARHASIKHAIESLGVPHTEVGRLLCDGLPAVLDAPVTEGQRIEVFPPGQQDGCPLRFLADAHLGALARRLRLLGFDTLLASDGPDHELAALAAAEDRIVLSRDREFLKHRQVRRGVLLRTQQLEAQLSEVASRYRLHGDERPFSRCLECNGTLEPVSRQAVLPELPPAVAATQSDFRRCIGCGRVYWPGSHWQRLRAIVEVFRARVAALSEGSPTSTRTSCPAGGPPRRPCAPPTESPGDAGGCGGPGRCAP